MIQKNKKCHLHIVKVEADPIITVEVVMMKLPSSEPNTRPESERLQRE